MIVGDRALVSIGVASMVPHQAVFTPFLATQVPAPSEQPGSLLAPPTTIGAAGLPPLPPTAWPSDQPGSLLGRDHQGRIEPKT